jgi:hypothetical protein
LSTSPKPQQCVVWTFWFLQGQSSCKNCIEPSFCRIWPESKLPYWVWRLNVSLRIHSHLCHFRQQCNYGRLCYGRLICSAKGCNWWSRGISCATTIGSGIDTCTILHCWWSTCAHPHHAVPWGPAGQALIVIDARTAWCSSRSTQLHNTAVEPKEQSRSIPYEELISRRCPGSDGLQAVQAVATLSRSVQVVVSLVDLSRSMWRWPFRSLGLGCGTPL